MHMLLLKVSVFRKKFLSQMKRKMRMMRCNSGSVVISVFTSVFLLCVSIIQLYVSWSSCSDEDSRMYLEEVCQNHSKRLISGSLCSPLCDTHEIRFEKCLGHGIKLHVLKANWNGNKVILKTPKVLGSRSMMMLQTISSKPLNNDFKVTREEFMMLANISVFRNIAGKIHTSRTTETLKEIFSECDLGGNGVLLLTEFLVCWDLIETGEYMLNLLLRDSSATVDVYGTCGNMYALQYADPEPFLGYKTSLSDTRSWSVRAQLAIAILELIESIEQTPYGTLYLCDAQEANFGLVKGIMGGDYVAKAIDLDISMFKYSLLLKLKEARLFNEVVCSRDSDCNFNSLCLGKCDLATGKCMESLNSNNLMIMCCVLFVKWHPLHPNLLNSPPISIADLLSKLIEKCTKPGRSQIDWDLFYELKSLLLNSIKK